MDDPDKESEIQEYSTSDGGSTMNWMLDKGLMLGKKALLTGIVISSAPFVLPPLVVFSALGLAFSVPSGLAVASYACTEKIMSKLLPMPNLPPPALEYVEEISSNDQEDNMGFRGEIDKGKEEEGLMEDKKRVVGVRIKFVDKGKEDMGKEEEELMEDTKRGVGVRMEFVDKGKEDMGKEEEELMEDTKRGVGVRMEFVDKGKEDMGEEEKLMEDTKSRVGVRMEFVDKGKEDMRKEEEELMEDTKRGVGVRMEFVDKGKEDMGKEEEELMEDTKRGVGLRIKFVDNGKEDMGKEEEELMEDTKRGVGVRMEFVDKGKEDMGKEEEELMEDTKRGVGVRMEFVDKGKEDMGKEEEELMEDTKRGVGVRMEFVDKGKEDMGKEEEELMEDTKRGVGVRMEFVDRGKEDMGKEEEELMEDTKRGVGVRIKFVDKGKEEWIEGKVLMEQDDLGPECILNDEAAEPVTQLGGDQLVEESGYEDDVEDNIPKEDGQPLEDIDVGVEESRDGKVPRLVILFEKNDSNVEEIRDEHPVNEIHRVVVKVEKMDENVEEGGTLIQVTTMANIKDEKELAGETTGLLERIRDEGKSMAEAQQQGKCISGGNPDEMSVDNIVEAEKLMNDGVETIDVRSIKEEEQGHIVYKKTMVVIGGMDVDNSITEDIPFDLRKENVISSNADVREIADESGFDLFDDKNAAASIETEECPGFRGENGRNFIPESKVLSEKDITVKSNEEQVPESEEKIWERIDAMRAIVGYKAPASRTCVEELKALYMFTGVEPPSSFKDPSDLMEVSSRLQFLMSIVGVK